MKTSLHTLRRLRKLALVAGLALVLASFAAPTFALDTPSHQPVRGLGMQKSTVLQAIAIPTVDRPASISRNTSRSAAVTLRATALLATVPLAAIAAILATRIGETQRRR